MQFANKTQFGFDPAPESFTATAVVNDAYTTPREFSERMGDLARLLFLRAKLKAKIKLSASDTGEFNVKLLAGSVVVGSGTISITADTVGYVVVDDIDLSAISAGISGQTVLTVVVDVTAATAAATAQVVAALDVEHPIVIGA